MTSEVFKSLDAKMLSALSIVPAWCSNSIFQIILQNNVG